MSVAIVQTATVSNNVGYVAASYNASSPSLTTTTITVGNLLVLEVYLGCSNSGFQINTPSGWTQIVNNSSSGNSVYSGTAIFAKVATSSDVSANGVVTVNFSRSSAASMSYAMCVRELSGAQLTGITYSSATTSGANYFFSGAPTYVGSWAFISIGVATSGSALNPATTSGFTNDLAFNGTSYGAAYSAHANAASASTATITPETMPTTYTGGEFSYLYFVPPASTATPQAGTATSTLTAQPNLVVSATFKATSALTAKPTLAARFTRFASSAVSALAGQSNAPVTYGLASAVVTAAASVTVALATAPAIGDILTVVIGAYDPTAISFTPPSGWTMIQHYTSGSGFSESAYFQRTATSADVTTHSYTFGLASSSSAARAVIFGVTGAVDATVSSIVGTVSGGGAPITGTGTAETAGTSELLVVFATSTRASDITAAPSISPALTSIGSIPFATDGSITPTVAGWTSTASFTTPTVTIDTSNNPNASLVGVMTMGFTASSVTMRTFAATSAASAKMLSLAKAAIASVSSAGARPKFIAAWSQKQTSAASAKSIPIAKTATKATSAASAKIGLAGRTAIHATSAATAKPKNVASATLKQTSTASAKAIPIGKTATKATSAVSARIGSIVRSVTRAMSTASAVPRLLAAFASSGSSAASAAAKIVANLTARATSVLTATGSWFIPGGTTYYHTGTASTALGAVQRFATSAVWRASSVTSAVSSLVGRSLGRASSTASARSTGRASSTVSAAAAASARALAAVAIREASSSTVSPKASAIARTAAKATAAASARLGVFAILLGRALVLTSAPQTIRAFFAAARSSVVTASGSWYALGGNVARTFTATSNAIAVGTNRMSLAFKATSAASARFAPIARPTAKAISAAIGAIRLSSASIAKATSTISPRVGIAAITRGAAAAVASARATLLVQPRLAAVSQAIGHIAGFVICAPIAAISLLQAHGNWYATSGVTLRTFAASSVASAREALAASSMIRATSVAVALERAKTLAGYLAASTVSARSASTSLVRRSANVGVSAKAALVNVRTFVAAVATSARIRFGVYSVAGASSTLTGVNRGRIVAILRGTVAAGARFAPVVRIVRGAIAAVSALAQSIFTGRTITVALPNGDGETIVAPLEMGVTIQAPLERGLTITAPIETLATIQAPLERGLTIFAPLQIAIVIDA